MGNKRRSVRFDEHTWMLLKEVSEKMGVNMSVVIRRHGCAQFEGNNG